MSIFYKKANRPQEFAAIDLGSNSFHMIIARLVDGAMQILGRLKQRVYLADGLDDNNMLSEEAIQRGLNCLALFARRLQGFNASNVNIVGTHAFRQAVNTEIFLQRAANIIPYPIVVISSYEEARLIFMGVTYTQSENGRKLVIDIGGGSTELIIGKGFEPELIESYHIGCISFAKIYFPNNVINKENFLRARLAAIRKLEPLSYQYQNLGWRYALGASGTIKTACEILRALGIKEKLITQDHLELLYNEAMKYRSFSELKLPGLSKDRKSVFVPGLAILQGIFDVLEIQKLQFSYSALREGVLYEMESRFYRHRDIRSRTARNLVNHYNIDREQAKRVLKTTDQLWKQWRDQNPKLDSPQLSILLKWAAILHEVGLSINHNGMHRHSAYILQNSNLPGFNQDQQLLLAVLVRYHRKTMKTDDLPRFSLFKKKQIVPLMFLLRLGALLNNQRQATIKPDRLTLSTDGGHWILYFPTGYFNKNILMQTDLERERIYWKDIPGWKLIIKEG